MFGDPVVNPKGWDASLRLGEIADIVSGVTKGRSVNGTRTRVVPYHIFRVRLARSSPVSPLFLNWLVGRTRGKRYFLRSAKQTTGIASINMTQLRGFPLLAPPVSFQVKFAARLARIEALFNAQGRSLLSLELLFASLRHRAFRGEL